MRTNVLKKAAKCGAGVFVLILIANGASGDEVEDQIALLHNRNEAIRCKAVETLGKLGDSRTVDPLIACLKDPGANVRYASALALGKLGNAGIVNSLIPCLQDSDLDVRQAASEDLVKIGTPALEQLIACLQNQDGGLRRSAAEVLAALGDDRAVAPLIGCLQDPHPYVRCAAADALVQLGRPSLEPLIVCLQDRNAGTRATAAEALGQLGDERAVAAIVKALPDWDCRIKFGEALNKLGWKPASEVERVYFRICKSDGTNLRGEWEKTKQVLLPDLQSGDSRKFANAVCAFISLGKEEIVSDLVRALNEHGTREMAPTYLSCGQDDLADAASEWTSAHGISSDGIGKAVWKRW
jgi:HEAT repeat protein